MRHKIMILGTFHMEGSAGDMHETKQSGILESKKQQEIEELRSMLAKFQPTKIAVECEKIYDDKLEKQYQAYLAGKFEPSENEIHQIAYPLAKQFGLSKVNCVDWMERGVGTCGYGDVYEYAMEKEPELFAELQKLEESPDIQNMTIREAFRAMNSREVEERTVAYYTNHARIGVGNNYVGLGWLMWWYQRNLILFANLSELVSEENEERIMVLIGNGHKGILSGLLQDSGLFEVVDTLDYL